MRAWLHHILFDPLSAWENMKITLQLLPAVALLYAGAWWLQTRKK